MPPSLVTVLLGDPRLPDRTKPGGAFTDDDFDQVRRLKSALDELASDYTFEYWDDHTSLLDDLQQRPPEFVLNFCDLGYRNEQTHELHVAAFLDVAGVPYSGAGPVALGLCYDKALVRAVAQESGIAVPWEVYLQPDDALPSLRYPAFIKPNRGDGSFGITAASLVHDAAQAESTVEQLRQQLPGQSLIIQEFLQGTEYGVGVVGNPGDTFEILPVLEVDYSQLDPALPRILDYGSKADPDSPYWTDVQFQEARLETVQRDALRDACATLFERLGLRDYGRCDFRSDANGTIKLMEINPNPAWCWDGKLAKMAECQGDRHSGLLRRILTAARRRVGLDAP